MSTSVRAATDRVDYPVDVGGCQSGKIDILRVGDQEADADRFDGSPCRLIPGRVSQGLAEMLCVGLQSLVKRLARWKTATLGIVVRKADVDPTNRTG